MRRILVLRTVGNDTFCLQGNDPIISGRAKHNRSPVRSCCLAGLLVLAATSVALGQDRLVADNSPAAERRGSLPLSSDTAVDQPLESVCCPSCSGSRWTASADFIILDRVGGVPYALVETVPHSVSAGSLASTPGTVMLNASDLQQGFSGGPKLGLYRHGDNGIDVELSYYQIDGWSDYESIGPTPNDWLVMRAAGNFLQTQDWKDTQMMAWDYASRLCNAELNVRWNISDRLKLLAGFRWTDLSEELQGTLPELPGTVPDRRNPFWDTRVRNNLYGFQVGADGRLFERGRFSIDGQVKTGIFINNAAETTAVSIDRTIFWASAATNQVACLGELGLQCKYQVTQKLLLKMGYEVLALQGVALAPGQISDTYCHSPNLQDTYVQALGINCGSGVFYHGATAGLEYAF